MCIPQGTQAPEPSLSVSDAKSSFNDRKKQTWDQKRMGSRPYRRMSITANIPPHPVADMSNQPRRIMWENVPNRKMLQLWCKVEKPRSQLIRTDSEHALGSQVVDNACCCIVLCGQSKNIGDT